MNKVAGHTCTICIISVVVFSLKLDNVHIAFVERSDHIPSMTFTDTDQYKGKNLNHIRVYQFEHIQMLGGEGVSMVPFSQTGFIVQRYSETLQFITRQRNIRSLSFHRRSLLPPKYSIIH